MSFSWFKIYELAAVQTKYAVLFTFLTYDLICQNTLESFLVIWIINLHKECWQYQNSIFFNVDLVQLITMKYLEIVHYFQLNNKK